MTERKKFLLLTVTAILLTSAIHTEILCENDFVRNLTQKIERAMLTDGNYDTAVEKLTVLLKTYPEDTSIHIDLGIAHYGAMEYKKAYGILKKIEGAGLKKGTKKLLLYMISNIDKNRIILSQIEGAKNALEEDGQSAREALIEAMAIGHYKVLSEILKEKYYYPLVAISHIIWIKNNVPDFSGIYRLSGDVYYSAMLYRKAEESYKRAIEKDPENSELHHVLADCLVAVGDFDSAEGYYDKSVELYKKQGLGESDAIVARLKKIRRALPKKYKDIDELIEDRNYDGAEALCKRRIALNPGDYVAIVQLGEIYWKRQSRKKAIKLFRKVVRAAPDYPIAHFFLGRAYVFEGKPEKGTAEFDIFKEKMELLPKTDDDTTDFYVSALHYISYMYSTLKQYDKAMIESKKIIDLKPDDQQARYNLAVCYYIHYRNRSRAYSELQRIIEIDPNTYMAGKAEFFIDYMRQNPDPRFIEDFTFIYEKE